MGRVSTVCCNVIHYAVGINPWARKCLISQPCSPSLSGSGSCKSDRETAQTLPNPDPSPWGPKSLRGKVMRLVLPVSWWERSQLSHQYFGTSMILQSKANELYLSTLCVHVCMSFAYLKNCSSDLLQTWWVHCWGPKTVQCQICCNLDMQHN